VRDCDAAVQPAFAQASFELAQVRGAACAELFSRDRGALVLEVLERREQGSRRCLSQARHLGLAKAAWAMFVIVVPVLGVLIYLIAQGQETRPPRPRGGPAQPGAGRRLRSLGGGVGRRGRRDREAKHERPSSCSTAAPYPGRVRRDQGEGGQLKRGPALYRLPRAARRARRVRALSRPRASGAGAGVAGPAVGGREALDRVAIARMSQHLDTRTTAAAAVLDPCPNRTGRRYPILDSGFFRTCPTNVNGRPSTRDHPCERVSRPSSPRPALS
jgi:hypothetical protein